MSFKNFVSSNKKLVGLITCGVLIVSGIIPLLIFTFFADPLHPYAITHRVLESEDGTSIHAVIYTPLDISGNHPGVVIGHGFTGNALHMQSLAIELVKRGIVVVNLDYHGHGSSDGFLPSFLNPQTFTVLEGDMMAGVGYLKGLGNIDRIGFLGHSMGSMTSLVTATNHPNEINATVLLGISGGFHAVMPFSYNLSRVKNMLIANGLFEQMFTPDLSLQFLQEYTNLNDVQLGQQYGSFANGNASKAVAGITEHLFEPLDPILIYEAVNWFELAFYGTIRWPITITSPINLISFALALFGILGASFVAIIYLSKLIWRKKETYKQKDLIENASKGKLIMFYLIGLIWGEALLLFPLAILFTAVLPIAMGELLYAQMVGVGLGTLVMYYFVVRTSEERGWADIPEKFKDACSGGSFRSLLFGVIAALMVAWLIVALASWTVLVSIPTLRELGAIFVMTILFFPWIFIKELYLRTLQGQLKFSSRIKEYFTMVGIGFAMDNLLIILLMLLTWGRSHILGSFLGPALGFVALALTVVVIYSLIIHVLGTWVYMYSGRNIIGSAIFICIFNAWMMINFYPFGLPLFF